ncbi:MAG: hypothetical protein J6Z22_03590, partial [Lachnospiraceae bacterium]|nr:hypothetical protein [Lachnospiraceae bacterium]
RFFFFGIPQIVFFIFTMSAIGVFSDATPFAYEFSELVNLIIFLCCGVFSTIYGLRQVRDWKIADIKLAKKKVR